MSILSDCAVYAADGPSPLDVLPYDADGKTVPGSRWSTQRQLKYVDEAVADGKEPLAQNLWQICSGFAHGREWATLGLLERTVHSQVGNVVQVSLSSSTEVLLNMLYMATLLTGKAKKLYDTRRTCHQ